jgi:hypothetical protein
VPYLQQKKMSEVCLLCGSMKNLTFMIHFVLTYVLIHCDDQPIQGLVLRSEKR